MGVHNAPTWLMQEGENTLRAEVTCTDERVAELHLHQDAGQWKWRTSRTQTGSSVVEQIRGTHFIRCLNCAGETPLRSV